MSILRGKHIILGVTAGIAAYKSPLLVRLLKKTGADVRVIMTPAAKDFVTPLTLSTLSENPVISDFTNLDDENDLWNNHVELGIWADLFIIAPVTANTLSKMVNGTSDNFLIATYLSAKCPVYFAPAMDLDMYKHPTTQKGFVTLQSYGNILIPSAYGELASGLVGKGRMAEPEDILKTIENNILTGLPLYGKKVLITAGPTYEQIDPVRFIGNYSTGKMGIELADSAARKGASVFLICGPTNFEPKESGVQTIKVSTAEEMYNSVHQYFNKIDEAILSAASELLHNFVTSFAKMILASLISAPLNFSNFVISDMGSSVNNFKNLITSKSSVFLQYCQKSQSDNCSLFNQIAPLAVLPIFDPLLVVRSGEVSPKACSEEAFRSKSIPVTILPH